MSHIMTSSPPLPRSHRAFARCYGSAVLGEWSPRMSRLTEPQSIEVHVSASFAVAAACEKPPTDFTDALHLRQRTKCLASRPSAFSGQPVQCWLLSDSDAG
jgi:hypothetical protein